jgi:small basic protein
MEETEYMRFAKPSACANIFGAIHSNYESNTNLKFEISISFFKGLTPIFLGFLPSSVALGNQVQLILVVIYGHLSILTLHPSEKCVC